MRVLFDMCAVSELQRPRPNASLGRFVDEIPAQDSFISVITLGEIIRGIELLQPGKRKRSLQSWVIGLESHFAERILSLDVETIRIWGELSAAAQKSGVIIPMADGLIAATARRHGLHLVTRNTEDFENTGALMINPWVDDGN